MSEYQIEICEILSRIVTISADNVDDAIDIVKQQYRNSDIVLNAEDYQGYDIGAI